MELIYFNSHPHEEDDNSSGWVRHSIQYFNSHPHEEDDKFREFAESVEKYFNSHPHEEDDTQRISQTNDQTISTHILTRRMTWILATSRLVIGISTHILTRRMTKPTRIIIRR